MKALYIECDMGAAGDMLSAALWEIVKDKERAKSRIESLGIPNTVISFDTKTSQGVFGHCTHVTVNGDEEGGETAHCHSTLDSINSIVNSLNTDENIKRKIQKVYSIIADAESKVHNTNVEFVHFHEVGALDAVADIAACAVLFDEINADIIVVSPINVGKGTVKCAHGILPVPAPATAEILTDTPYYVSDDNYGELCTPTGAAVLKEYADYFGSMPVIKVERKGIGFGKKEFKNRSNCVRAYFGEICIQNNICQLVASVDDMTAEEISYAVQLFLKNGALDAYSQSIQMKKGRAGYNIHVLCRFEDKDKFLELVFKNTSTIGIREILCERYALERKVITKNTKYGDVRVKISSGFGVKKQKIEYDDIEKIAEKTGFSFFETKKILEDCINNSSLQS